MVDEKDTREETVRIYGFAVPDKEEGQFRQLFTVIGPFWQIPNEAAVRQLLEEGWGLKEGALDDLVALDMPVEPIV